MFISISSSTIQPNNVAFPAYSLLYSYIDTNISAAVGYLRRWFFPTVLFLGWKNKKVFLPAAYFCQSATICMWTVKHLHETPSWLRARLHDVTPSFVWGRNKSDNRGRSESSKSMWRWFKMQWVYDNSEQQINAEGQGLRWRENRQKQRQWRSSGLETSFATEDKTHLTLMPLIGTSLHAPPPVLVYVCRHTHIYIYIIVYLHLGLRITCPNRSQGKTFICRTFPEMISSSFQVAAIFLKCF